MSLYKGNNLISGHNILYSTTGQNTDGAMTQKATTDNFANTNLTNLGSTSSTNFDGQWVVPSTGTIVSDATMTSTDVSYDLSSILPNDNYNYEVICSGYASTGNVSGNRIAIQLRGITTAFMVGGVTRTATTVNYYGSCTVIVGANRTITCLGITNPNGSYTIYIGGYRRIGTNL